MHVKLYNRCNLTVKILTECHTQQSRTLLKLETISQIMITPPMNILMRKEHRRSQGVQWVYLQTSGRWKKFSQASFTGKMCKCTPRTRSASPNQSKSQLLVQFLLRVLQLEVYLDGLWEQRLKRSLTFLAKKCTPRQNPGYPYRKE